MTVAMSIRSHYKVGESRSWLSQRRPERVPGVQMENVLPNPSGLNAHHAPRSTDESVQRTAASSAVKPAAFRLDDGILRRSMKTR